MTAKYVGEGTYIPGVPARDLTKEEYAKHKKTIKVAEKAACVTLYELSAEMPAEVEEESN